MRSGCGELDAPLCVILPLHVFEIQLTGAPERIIPFGSIASRELKKAFPAHCSLITVHYS
jgi:hypothetical protein